MGNVHSLPGEQLNPVDGDIVEISHETYVGSGVWSSLKLKLSTLKSYIIANSSIGLTKLGEITPSYSNPTSCQNQTLKFIHIKYVSGSPKFKIGSTSGTDDLLNETDTILDDTVLAVFTPCFLTYIYPRVTGTGTLNITLEFTSNLFDE